MSANWSKAQEIILAVASVPSGLLSFVSSATIIVMIFRSPTKLDNARRRIIFALSFYDLTSSLAAIASSLPSPSGMRWGAIGNQGTCVTQAIFLQIGSLGSPLYNLMLAIYYLCIIKFNMSNQKFKEKLEMKLHIFANLYVWFSVIFLSIDGSFNFTRATCWIGPSPIDCVHNPDVDCIRGAKSYLYQWVFAGGPVLISFLGNLACIFVLIWNMLMLKRQLNRLSTSSWRQLRSNERDETDEQRSVFRRLSSQLSSFRSSVRSSISQPTTQQPQVQVAHRSGSITFTRPVQSTRSRTNRYNMQRDLIVQAMLYSAAFLFVYLFSYIYRIFVQVNGEGGGGAPFVVVLLARIMQPLQGFLNILVYTRISVLRLYRDSEFSWFQSFWVVVSSAFDQDDISMRRKSSLPVISESGASSRRRSSHNNSKANPSAQSPSSDRQQNIVSGEQKPWISPLRSSMQSSLREKEVKFLFKDESLKDVENVESDGASFVQSDELCSIHDTDVHDTDVHNEDYEEKEIPRDQHQQFATNSIKYENENNLLLDVVDLNETLEGSKCLAIADASESEQSLESFR